MSGSWLGRALVALLLGLLLVPPVVARPPAVSGLPPGADLAVEGGWVRLSLRGTPREMGVQQGTLLRPYLRDLLATHLYPALSRGDVSLRDARRAVRLVALHLPDAARAELEGIAQGAGVALEEVLLWNLRDELLAWGEDLPYAVQAHERLGAGARPLRLPGPPVRGAPAERLPWPAPLGAGPLASGVALAAWGSATLDGDVQVAAALAAPPGGEALLLVVRHPDEGQPSAGLALPGEVGLRAGWNRAGVGLVVMPFATADRALDGVPTTLLVRQVLDHATSPDEAIRALVDADRATGATALVADGAGEPPQRLTWSARQVQQDDGDGAFHVVTGAPSAGTLAASARLLPQATPPATAHLVAWQRANAGVVSRATVQALLADPVLREGRSGAMVVWVPATGRLWLAGAAQGEPAPASGWTLVELGPLWDE